MTIGWKTASVGAKLQEHSYRVARAVGLAAMLVGLAPVVSEAEPMFIDCTESSCNATFTTANEVADYWFGDYTFRLGFDEVLSEEGFTIHIDDFFLSQSDFQERIDLEGPFAGFKCVEIAFGDGNDCVEFVASAPYPNSLPTPGEDFTADPGAINIGIAYDIVGYPLFGDPVDIGETDNFTGFISAFDPELGFRLLHAPGDSSTFSENITFGGDNGHCTVTGADSAALDACAAEKGFSFDSPTTVPEPASILLFGPGVLGLAYLRRRGGRRG